MSGAGPDTWSAPEVRAWLEDTFRRDGADWDVELLGTLVGGDDVVAVVRSRRDGHLHRVTSDLAELRAAIAPPSWELITGEVLFRSLDPWTLNRPDDDRGDPTDWW